MHAALFRRSAVAGVAFFLSLCVSAQAIELAIPARSCVVGQKLDLPVVVDYVENLAGLKMVIRYNPEVILFKNSQKTESAAPLMQATNDKTPGILIIVMAAAKGIKGENMTLLNLGFEAIADGDAALQISESQLMSDQLKTLEHSTKVDGIRIVADNPEK